MNVEKVGTSMGPSHNYRSTYLILLNNNIDQSLGVLRKDYISNQTYGLSYYNTLAALWKRCQAKSETTNIVMHALDSAAMAITNLNNSDTHIIKLRENMARSRINLFLVPKEEWTKLLDKILQLSIPADQKVVKYLWPDVSLRKLCNIQGGALGALRKQRLASKLTRTMRHLCPLTDPWSSLLALDQISNKTILMLTGLVTNEQKLLVRGELAPRIPGTQAARVQETPELTRRAH